MLVNVLNGVQTYFITADRNPARITKTDKDFSKNFDFKDIKSPVKVRDMHEIEKKNSIALVFLVMKIWENIQCIYQKNVVKSNMLILLLKQ